MDIVWFIQTNSQKTSFESPIIIILYYFFVFTLCSSSLATLNSSDLFRSYSKRLSFPMNGMTMHGPPELDSCSVEPSILRSETSHKDDKNVASSQST